MAVVKGTGALLKAFQEGFARVVYVTSCYPSEEKMVEVLMGIQESGVVDVVEVGVPFTDPVGDGPVIEKCGLDAINISGCQSIFTVLEVLRKARGRGFSLPLVLMGYYNTFVEGWIEACKDLVSGVIIVDLPFEEPGTHALIEKLNAADVSFIPLCTPFTSAERLAKISTIVTSFLYCTCVSGVTGARASLAEYLNSEYKPVWERVRANTEGKNKIIGFGVSDNAAVQAVKGLGVNGLVVGSALMKVCSKERRRRKKKKKYKTASVRTQPHRRS